MKRNWRDLQDVLNRIEAAMPAAYEDRSLQLHEVNLIFRNWLAKTTGPALNERFKAWPVVSYDDYKHVSHWINHEARRFGLAVACPVSGEPSLLFVSTTGGGRRHPRFKFMSLDATDGRRQTCTRRELDEITLVPTHFEFSAAARNAANTPWSARIDKSQQKPRGIE